MLIQLDLFEHYSETEMLEIQLKEMIEKYDKLRKSLYARHNELAKKYCDLQYRMDIIERNLCNGNGKIWTEEMFAMRK